MSMCEKTGALAYIEEYDCWVLGDMYTVGNVRLLRHMGRHYGDPPRDRCHYTVRRVAQWFYTSSDYSHLLALADDAIYHGYEGVPADGLQASV